jgi:hypothetical protein
MKRTVLNARTIEEFLVYIRDQLKSHIRKPLVGKRIYHVVRFEKGHSFVARLAINIAVGIAGCYLKSNASYEAKIFTYL